MQGIDVSIHQGHIDWPAVAAAGYRFALCKASEGVGWTDQLFWQNWADIRRAGLFRGAYHFARPGLGNAPAAEARWFLRQVREAGDLQPCDALALDLEDPYVAGRQELASWALEWLATVEQETGIRPLFYSYPAYLQEHGLMTAPELARFPLWLAWWKDEFPAAPAPWTAVTIWQYTANGRVPGVGGPVDCNVCPDPSFWTATRPSSAAEEPFGPCSPADWEIVQTVRALGGDAASVRGWIELIGAQEETIRQLTAALRDAAATITGELDRPQPVRRRALRALLRRFPPLA